MISVPNEIIPAILRYQIFDFFLELYNFPFELTINPVQIPILLFKFFLNCTRVILLIVMIIVFSGLLVLHMSIMVELIY